MNDAVLEHTGVDFYACRDGAEAIEKAKSLGLEIEDKTAPIGKVLFAAFDEFVESKLIQPTFIIDYPVEVSPLTKRKPDNPGIVERFELFIAGAEYCNAFSELNDPIDQRARFEQQAQEKAKGDDEAMPIDETSSLHSNTECPHRRHRFRHRQDYHAPDRFPHNQGRSALPHNEAPRLIRRTPRRAF